MAKKTYVLDTNVYLSDATSISAFGNNDIVIPLKVLEEIDKHKKRQDGVGANARKIIRTLDELRDRGCLRKGVRLGKGKGIVRARPYNASTILPHSFDIENADNKIIGVALGEQEETPKRKVIVVSRDINMRVKCDALGILCEGYVDNQVVEDLDDVYSGFTNQLVDEQVIDRFYNHEDVILDEETNKLYDNQFLMLVSNSNPKKTALARLSSVKKPLNPIIEYRQGIWGVYSRNKEQTFAIDLLMNEDIPIITLTGKAGCGKTLLAVAAGLQQVLETKKYKRLVISRPVQPLGKDIGFLPGTLEEKMAPWIAPIEDNLKHLMNDDKASLDMYTDKGLIEVEALTYIRGRSITNAFIVIDEAQNLTNHELKTILTRVGENTKIVLTGDIEQIDNVYLDETTNGLTYAIEKFKDCELAGHISLRKGERSRVATLASKVL